MALEWMRLHIDERSICSFSVYKSSVYRHFMLCQIRDMLSMIFCVTIRVMKVLREVFAHNVNVILYSISYILCYLYLEY